MRKVDGKKKDVDIYFVNRNTGRAHAMIGCAMQNGKDGGRSNIDKVGKEDIEVEVDTFCGTCCYESK